VKTEDLIPYPWPFPQWNGERMVMPMELAPDAVKNVPKRDPLEDAEEAPF
jgi:hypothetical protein